jgi:hypothetical protein
LMRGSHKTPDYARLENLWSWSKNGGFRPF